MRAAEAGPSSIFQETQLSSSLFSLVLSAFLQRPSQSKPSTTQSQNLKLKRRHEYPKENSVKLRLPFTIHPKLLKHFIGKILTTISKSYHTYHLEKV